jgi:hypothetical protein
MKTLQILGFVLILPFFSMKAQSPQYFAAMKENLAKFGRAKTSDSLQAVEAQFERIAMTEKNQWIPYYYAAQVLLIQSFSQKPDAKDKILDQAQTLLDESIKAKGDSSECMALQGFLYIGRLQADPQGRAAEYSMKAQEMFDLAIKLNPENPRAYYLKGVTLLNTPEFFGGGKVPAKPILTLAAAKFTTFNSSYPFFPKWGKDDCEKQLNRCN